ncbi:MAG: hypothetical protein Q9157_006657 [Trypethelium eluteriae]
MAGNSWLNISRGHQPLISHYRQNIIKTAYQIFVHSLSVSRLLLRRFLLQAVHVTKVDSSHNSSSIHYKMESDASINIERPSLVPVEEPGPSIQTSTRDSASSVVPSSRYQQSSPLASVLAGEPEERKGAKNDLHATSKHQKLKSKEVEDPIPKDDDICLKNTIKLLNRKYSSSPALSSTRKPIPQRKSSVSFSSDRDTNSIRPSHHRPAQLPDDELQRPLPHSLAQHTLANARRNPYPYNTPQGHLLTTYHTLRMYQEPEHAHLAHRAISTTSQRRRLAISVARDSLHWAKDMVGPWTSAVGDNAFFGFEASFLKDDCVAMARWLRRILGTVMGNSWVEISHGRLGFGSEFSG